MRTHGDDVIELRAVDPSGDLACDFVIASETARSGLRESLAAGIVRPIRMLDNGVEVTFRADAWDVVRRYIELESRCCSFLNLSAHRMPDAITLTVTGRPEARELIATIFAED